MQTAIRRRKQQVAFCRSCKQEFPWSNFAASPSRRPFGLASQCLDCDRKRKSDQKYRKYRENPEFYKAVNRRKRLQKFGLTVEEYEEMLRRQGGVCALCKKPETYIHHASRKPASLSVDHCHITGKVRALLCANCNKGIGCFKDSPDLLIAAAAYVKNHSGDNDNE